MILYNDDIHKMNKYFQTTYIYDLEKIIIRPEGLIGNYTEIYKNNLEYGELYIIFSDNIKNVYWKESDYEILISNNCKKVIFLNETFKNDKKVTFTPDF